MEQYHQLTEYQRYQLAALRKEGRPQKTMAANLGVHPSTISRELHRNRGPTRLSIASSAPEDATTAPGSRQGGQDRRRWDPLK